MIYVSYTFEKGNFGEFTENITKSGKFLLWNIITPIKINTVKVKHLLEQPGFLQ